jgi:hypothetical protein
MRLVGLFLLATGLGLAASAASSLTMGKADMKSAGVLAFGPEGILFAGDPAGASIFAIDTDDNKAAPGVSIDWKAANEKIAALLGTAADQITINDVAVNPVSHKVYFSVSRGKGAEAMPVLLRLDSAGKLSEVSLANVKHSKVVLPNPGSAEAKGRGPSPRMESITDLAYVNGKLIVAGLSNEEFSSSLRTIAFPFTAADRGTSVEIFHGAHGRFETAAPVRTFVPYTIAGKPHLLAAYTCTPLVKFSIDTLKEGQKVMGTTIAELGSGNRPLDMIKYTKGGKDYILMSNSARGVMKISVDQIEKYESITKRTEITGVPYETIASLKGVEQLDLYDSKNALMLIKGEGGSLDLKTIALP